MRPHQIQGGQWIDLDTIRAIWVVDYDPAYMDKLLAGCHDRPLRAKSSAMQCIVWVAISAQPGQMEIGRFGDRADALDKANALGELWTGKPVKPE